MRLVPLLQKKNSYIFFKLPNQVVSLMSLGKWQGNFVDFFKFAHLKDYNYIFDVGRMVKEQENY